MILQLREMVRSLLPPLDFQPVTSDILFLLILVELFRLLIIYLQEHRVSIGVAVEVSIVSVLREIIVRGVLETPWAQVLVACVFLLVLGALLVIRVWIPPTFDGIDPEQIVSERHRSRAIEDKLESKLGAYSVSKASRHQSQRIVILRLISRSLVRGYAMLNHLESWRFRAIAAPIPNVPKIIKRLRKGERKRGVLAIIKDSSQSPKLRTQI